ncbi:MFS transporter [Acinetobacter sp.]|uniref:MFS transporter n=1 Tax=Acinetobacter sp. TaxID=472 RepID=UPI00334111ED
MRAFPIQYRLSGFYFWYYSIVGTFLPYWSLYLQDQGFSYKEIGLLSSIAILTRIFAPFIWGFIADKTGKRMLLVRIATWMEATIWLLIFIIPNNMQSIALLMLIFSFFQNAILAQFEGVTLFWLGNKHTAEYGKIRKWGSIGFIVGVFSIGAILDVIDVKYLPIMLLCIAFSAFIWSFSIKEPNSAPSAQKILDPVWPIIKRPVVLAFFTIEFIMLFAQAPFYSFYSNYLKLAGFNTTQIGFLWAVGVIAEIIMFNYANFFLTRFSWRSLVALCLVMTSIRFVFAGLFSESFLLQFISQSFHAFSFGLFHIIAMRVILQNFAAQQQGRGQAVYSTMWGLGVASGSILAGHYWEQLTGEYVFIIAGLSALLGLLLIQYLPKTLQAVSK